jgi:hypothetical protein
MGRKRAARRSIRACSEGLGRPVSAARSGGSGGSCRRARGEKQREEESKLERERDGGGRGLLILSSGAVGGGAHRGRRSVNGESSTEQLHCSTKKTKCFLQKAPCT